MESASLSNRSNVVERFIRNRPKPTPGRKYIPLGIKLILSGTSAASATLVTHPFDVLKVNLQMNASTVTSGSSPTSLFLKSVKDRGISILYSGVTAAVMRQLSYGSARLAIFDSLMTMDSNGATPGFGKKLLFSGTAGGIGALVGNPADMTLVRMAADSRLPAEERRNYKNVFDALSRIRKEEGILAWWKGSTPTVARCVVVNVAQLTTYSQAKEELLGRGYIKEDGIKCHVAASMIAGLVATFATQPVDVVKTRVQNAHGSVQPGVVQALRQIARDEGVMALWKGFWPSYARMGPQTTIMFILFEALKKQYQNMA